MKFAKILSILVVALFFSCGGDDETTTTTNPNTDGSPSFQAILTVMGANPANGNGDIEVTSVTSDVNPSGGNQSIHIVGKTTLVVGDDTLEIRHQIDINYYISYVDGQALGNVTQISHAWGSSLEGSLDGGISVCESATTCNLTHLNPTLNTIVFGTQTLNNTPNLSTLGGTVVYP